VNPGGYSYSRFCELYRAFEFRLPVTMRQTHGNYPPPFSARRSGRGS
jgi:transposase